MRILCDDVRRNEGTVACNGDRYGHYFMIAFVTRFPFYLIPLLPPPALATPSAAFPTAPYSSPLFLHFHSLSSLLCPPLTLPSTFPLELNMKRTSDSRPKRVSNQRRRPASPTGHPDDHRISLLLFLLADGWTRRFKDEHPERRTRRSPDRFPRTWGRTVPRRWTRSWRLRSDAVFGIGFLVLRLQSL